MQIKKCCSWLHKKETVISNTVLYLISVLTDRISRDEIYLRKGEPAWSHWWKALSVFVVFTPKSLFFSLILVPRQSFFQMASKWKSHLEVPWLAFSYPTSESLPLRYLHFTCLDTGMLLPGGSWGCIPTAFPGNLKLQCVFVAKEAHIFLGDCIRKSIASESREKILPLYSALVRQIWSTGSSFSLPSTREVWMCWSGSSEGPHILKGLKEGHILKGHGKEAERAETA